MSEPTFSLPRLGWSHFFQQQLSLEEWQSTTPARVVAVHRNALEVAGDQGWRMITLPGHWHLREPEELPTVGDWLLLDPATGQVQRLLERKSLVQRRAAGIESRTQLLAANIDTLFVVTSCNEDFNLSRLERYLALAFESNVEPVLVLTKADLLEDVAEYRRQAMSLNPTLAIETVNALDPASVASLAAWCSGGHTVALLGSSGVGKSTLINTLSGSSRQETAAIREDDAKGRHTTTSRTLHLLPAGGLLIDSPGMRELQLSDCQDGVAALFEDIETLARSCRFTDCRHQHEDGCAIQANIARGELSPRRLASYQKLLAEQARNTESIADRRRRERNFGKHVRSVLAARRKEHNDH